MRGKINHSNNFDLIRLLAAMQVMYAHIPECLHVRYLPGQYGFWLAMLPGVAIFFVVSGFLIPGSHLGNTLGDYAKSRVLRIYPALWVNLTVILFLLLITRCMALSPKGPGFWAWLAIAYPIGSDWSADRLIGPMWQPGFYPWFPSGVLWTIPVELSFYVLVPVIFAKVLPQRFLGLSLLVWMALSLVCFATIDRRNYPIFIGLYLWVFLLGAAMRLYWPRIEPFLRGKFVFWGAAYAIGVYSLHRLTGGYYAYTVFSVVNILLTVLLACAVISFAFTAPNLAGKLLRGNDLSYGLYLWHVSVMLTVAGFGFTGHWYYAAVVIPLAFGAAALSWFLIERPALALKKRRRTPHAKMAEEAS